MTANLAAVLHAPGDVRIERRPVPAPGPREVLVEIRVVGVCGSDVHYFEHGRIGDHVVRAPLVLGHESAGVVAGVGSDARRHSVGDRVALEPGVPCGSCRECRAGRYNLCPDVRFFATPPVDGAFANYVTIHEDFAFPVPAGLSDEEAALMEPLSVAIWACRKGHVGPDTAVLVTGAGPIGLLAALMGAQRGLEVHVLDRASEGPKPEAVHALGAHYHSGDIDEVAKEVEPDLVVECTGVAELVAGAMQHTAPGAIVCLTGVATSRTLSVDVGAFNNELVLENDVIFGSVNANRRHFEQAVNSLHAADPDWLRRLITHSVPLERWTEALKGGGADIKVVVDFSQG